jgi:signal transduction histidine kinase
MEKLSRLIRGALAEMRSLLIELRSDAKPDQSLVQLLNTLVEGARARSNMTINMTVDGDLDPPPDVTMTFYRIAQESLNNVIKHAVATQVEITLVRTSSHVELDIKDDGHGFEPDNVSSGHMGISIMAERAGKIGGDLRVKSRPGQGTEVKAAWTESEGRKNHD